MAVDIGGTFTDVVVEHEGARTTTKVLTTSHAPEEGVLEGIAAAVSPPGSIRSPLREPMGDALHLRVGDLPPGTGPFALLGRHGLRSPQILSRREQS